MDKYVDLERSFKRYREAAQELHLPVLEAFITLEAFDKAGNMVSRLRRRSHSWTRNAYNLMFSQLASVNGNDSTFEAGKVSMKDTGGTVRYSANGIGLDPDTTFEGTSQGYRAAAADDTQGIVVGSGTDAEDFEDYALATQIADGTGAGELSHVLSEAMAITYAALVLKNTLIRYFNNNSGDSIDVNEVAIYARLDAGAAVSDFMMCRDKLGSAVTVPNTGQLKVTYEITLTYPS